MSLTPEQLRLREGKITASFVPALMAGKTERIYEEWCRLVGHPEAPAAVDLSEVWKVEFGSYIEPFALDWHEHKTEQTLTRRGEVVSHPSMSHICCTLDAWRAADNRVIDCKASWLKLDEICAYYLPQIIVQKSCAQADAGSLLVVQFGYEPREYPLKWDHAYERAVWERIDQFWQCVITLTPPVAMPEKRADRPIAIKEASMQSSNAWAANAGQWLECQAQAKRFANAEKEIKALIANDVARAFGHGIEVKRNKAGALSIRAL